MRLQVKKLSKDDWRELSEAAHLSVFNEKRSSSVDRIDYALLCETADKNLVAFMTCRELDDETVYWQHGGSFPRFRDTLYSFASYSQFVEWHREKYKRVTTLIENTNTVYLKFAMKVGFKIIGVRNFDNQILLEHLLEF